MAKRAGSAKTDPEAKPSAPQATLREAVHELQRYFSDELAPMMATDSVTTLIQLPPAIAASAIQGWVGVQYRGAGADVPVSDYLFHAVKKLHQMTEYGLIEGPVMTSYLGQLAPLLLTLCPEGDRALLAEGLRRIGESSESGVVAPVEVLYRQSGRAGKTRPGAGGGGGSGDGGAARGAAEGRGVERGMRRLSLLLERLGRSGTAQPAAEPAEGAAGGVALAPRIVASAAVQARSSDELGVYLGELRTLGVDAGMAEVFRSLGSSVPGWVLSAPATDAGAVQLPASHSVEAMHRIISLAADPEEGARRFQEMLQAAIDQFNSGSLAQAAAMIDLARRIVDEKQLAGEVVDDIRRRSQDALDVEQLRRYAEKPEKQVLLRRVMEFFPAFTVRGLLTDLNGEPRRERRRLLLALLEAHGVAARDAALELLESYAQNSASDPHGYYQRNLVYLLRRIAPSEDQTRDAELGLLAHFAGWGTPLLVIREAIAALGQLHHDQAEEILITRLQEVEQMLVDGDGETYDTEELRGLLDWIVAALSRLGTPDALRAAVDHAFERHAPLGDTMSRLDELSGRDLSGDPVLVERLVTALRRELPTRVLGLVVGKNDANIVHLIRALSHTPVPEVRRLLEEIVERFADRSYAAEASKALSSLGAQRRSGQENQEEGSSLTGDVELFGLPNLLQSLADSQVSGTLTLADAECETIATMIFDHGKIRSCKTGTLHGEAAFYQLFEKPVPGTFEFKRRFGDPERRNDDDAPTMEVMPAILEAMRRHDEFQQARAIVPDDASLAPSGAKPTPLEDERDAAFTKSVWVKAAAGFTPEQCETALSVDSYRVRKLFTHWVETGALQPR